MSIFGIPTAATCVCTHGRPQRSTDVLAGPTQFGSIRVVGDILCRPRLASEGGFHGCDGKNVRLLSFGAPVYVYVEAAQPELGMLIVGDVDAALAALHRGDLGAFRFQKNHRERTKAAVAREVVAGHRGSPRRLHPDLRVLSPLVRQHRPRETHPAITIFAGEQHKDRRHEFP